MHVEASVYRTHFSAASGVPVAKKYIFYVLFCPPQSLREEVTYLRAGPLEDCFWRHGPVRDTGCPQEVQPGSRNQ